MNKSYFIMLLLFIVSFNTNFARARIVTKPRFAQSIILLKHRDIATRLDGQYSNKISPVVLAWLTQHESYDMLEQVIGRQLTHTGHDKVRKEVHSGQTITPQHLILTFSGKSTLEDTVQGLKNQGLAHNFIINRNGDIHPVTNENESIEDALKHRLYSVGVCNHVINGHYEQRDMNSASITICVVGQADTECSKNQTQSLTQLIAYLQNQYNIRPDQVLDYGCVACFSDSTYGRRIPNHLLPWKELAQNNLATYPINYHNIQNPLRYFSKSGQTLFTALALRKIGYACPICQNPEQPEFKKALAIFQQHAQADTQDGNITDITIRMLIDMIQQHEKHNALLKDIAPNIQ